MRIKHLLTHPHFVDNNPPSTKRVFCIIILLLIFVTSKNKNYELQSDTLSYPATFRNRVGKHDGLAEYKLTDNSLDIIHTFVPPALEGRGIASALTEAAYDYAKANHLKPEGTCSYAAVWLKRHPEYLQ